MYKYRINTEWSFSSPFSTIVCHDTVSVDSPLLNAVIYGGHLLTWFNDVDKDFNKVKFKWDRVSVKIVVSVEEVGTERSACCCHTFDVKKSLFNLYMMGEAIYKMADNSRAYLVTHPAVRIACLTNKVGVERV